MPYVSVPKVHPCVATVPTMLHLGHVAGLPGANPLVFSRAAPLPGESTGKVAGRHMADKWQWASPTTGEGELSIRLSREDTQDKHDSRLVVYDPAVTAGMTPKILMLGDSITSDGPIPAHGVDVAAALGGYQPQMVGPITDTYVANGTSYEVGHLGVGGADLTEWAYKETFSRRTNLAYDAATQAWNTAKLLEQMDTPNVVVAMLGTNDSARPQHGGQRRKAMLEDPKGSLAAARHIFRDITDKIPGVKIIVALSPPPSDQNGVGTSAIRLGRNDTVHWDNVRYLNRLLMQEFEGPDWPNVLVFHAGAAIDPRHSYPTTEVEVWPGEGVFETVPTNLVHPSDAGYRRIAQMLYAAITHVLVADGPL